MKRYGVWAAMACTLLLSACGHRHHMEGRGGSNPQPVVVTEPVRINLFDLPGGAGPLPIVQAEPLYFSLAAINNSRAALTESKKLFRQGDSTFLSVSFVLGAPKPNTKIDVQIVGREPINGNEGWQKAVERLSTRLQAGGYCSKMRALPCTAEGTGSNCAIDVSRPSVFKYIVRVYPSNADPQKDEPLSCLDPWSVIN